MHRRRFTFLGVLGLALSSACLYKSEMHWDGARDERATDAARRVLPSRPRVRGKCVRALIAVREPQSSTGAWGKTEVVTFVEMDKLGACPAVDAEPADPKQRKDFSLARSLALKDGGVVAIEDATDWALGTDDGGNTWRSRTFTTVVEKRRGR